MDNILMMRFLMGWFDRLDQRLYCMKKYDQAINSERKTMIIHIETDF